MGALRLLPIAAVVVIAGGCNDKNLADRPVGGPCEYDHYEGTCSFAGLDSKPNDHDPDRLWVSVRHRTNGAPVLELEDTIALARWELKDLEAHYEETRVVPCKVSKIKRGTCNPQSAAYERSEFHTPGSALHLEPPCSNLEACKEECRSTASVAACDRAAYLLHYGVSGKSDPEAAESLYAVGLRERVEACKHHDGMACADAANRLHRGLGHAPDAETEQALLSLACKLGETRSCTDPESQAK